MSRPVCVQCGVPYGSRGGPVYDARWMGGQPPFCTKACALVFARSAYKTLGELTGELSKVVERLSSLTQRVQS